MVKTLEFPQPDGTVLVMTQTSEFTWSSRYADGSTVVDKIVASFDAGEVSKKNPG